MQVFTRYQYCYNSCSTTPRKIHALGADARLHISRCQSKNLEKSYFACRLTACPAIQTEITHRIAIRWILDIAICWTDSYRTNANITPNI